MRSKGFTLIELLAVIVILAIIALIATPIILGIINDSRESAAKESAKLVTSSFELAYNTAFMNGGGTLPTLVKVREAFNMDGATWDATTNKITAENGVSCDVTGDETTGTGYFVSCKVNDGDVVATSVAVTVAVVTNP